jgi:hypothetical protein
MLRTGAGAGAGVSISNILRIGTIRGELETPFVATLGERLGSASRSISNILRTGDRGFVKGDEARPESFEPDDPLVRPAGGPSNKARTSFRSSSNIDSNDICFAIVADVVDGLHYDFSMMILVLQGCDDAKTSCLV